MSINREKKYGKAKMPPSAKSGFGHWNKLILGGLAIFVVSAMFWWPRVNTADTPEITVYKSPTCGCCSKWIEHLREEGFKVTTHDRNDMNQIKQSYGVDYNLRSCHTATVQGYVVEGHVPGQDIRRLLEEKTAVAGLAVPGMPMGSPGMEGKHADPYDVIAFGKDGRQSIYARY